MKTFFLNKPVPSRAKPEPIVPVEKVLFHWHNSLLMLPEQFKVLSFLSLFLFFFFFFFTNTLFMSSLFRLFTGFFTVHSPFIINTTTNAVRVCFNFLLNPNQRFCAHCSSSQPICNRLFLAFFPFGMQSTYQPHSFVFIKWKSI